jgi:hypothetical protein
LYGLKPMILPWLPFTRQTLAGVEVVEQHDRHTLFELQFVGIPVMSQAHQVQITSSLLVFRKIRMMWLLYEVVKTLIADSLALQSRRVRIVAVMDLIMISRKFDSSLNVTDLALQQSDGTITKCLSLVQSVKNRAELRLLLAMTFGEIHI